MTTTDDAMAHLADTMAKRTERWEWPNVDPVVRAEFASRMEPGLDPEEEWSLRSIRIRRELAFHLLHPAGHAATPTEVDSHRLQMEADQASVQAFRVLVGLKAER